MSWDMYNSTRPNIYNWILSSKRYELATPPYYAWALGTLWQQQEACIKFINDTGNPIRFTRIAIKTVACDSGGESFWAFGYLETTPCKGYGAQYTCYIRVSNDGGKTFTESDKFTNDIATISGANMNTPGYDATHTAQFGDPPFTGDKALQLRNYTFTSCPVINPNGIAYVHLNISNFKGPAAQTVIRFKLNPLEMEIDYDPGISPYIWRFSEDSKWHLVRPFNIYNNGWKNVEGDQ